MPQSWGNGELIKSNCIQWHSGWTQATGADPKWALHPKRSGHLSPSGSLSLSGKESMSNISGARACRSANGMCHRADARQEHTFIPLISWNIIFARLLNTRDELKQNTLRCYVSDEGCFCEYPRLRSATLLAHPLPSCKFSKKTLLRRLAKICTIEKLLQHFA